MKTPLRILALGIGMSVSACGHDEPARAPVGYDSLATRDLVTRDAAAAAYAPADVPPTAAPVVSAGVPALMDAGAAVVAASGAVPAAAMDGGSRLTNDQILQVTRTANGGEIAQAELAHTHSHDGRVLKLAAQMLRDHTEAENKGDALAHKEALSPEPSPASVKLETDASNATNALRQQAGAQFDKSYLDVQVREHQAVLDLLASTLIPSSTDSDLTAYLHDVKATVAEHLDHARALQRELEK